MRRGYDSYDNEDDYGSEGRQSQPPIINNS